MTDNCSSQSSTKSSKLPTHLAHLPLDDFTKIPLSSITMIDNYYKITGVVCMYYVGNLPTCDNCQFYYNKYCQFTHPTNGPIIFNYLKDIYPELFV